MLSSGDQATVKYNNKTYCSVVGLDLKPTDSEKPGDHTDSLTLTTATRDSVHEEEDLPAKIFEIEDKV